MGSDNIIARILLWIGIIEIIAGVIVGIVMGIPERSYYDFSIGIFLLWCIGGFIGGMMFIGFSEIIKILHEIRANTYIFRDQNSASRKFPGLTGYKMKSID